MELRIPYALLLLLTRRLDRNFVTSRLSSGFQSNLIVTGQLAVTFAKLVERAWLWGCNVVTGIFECQRTDTA
jgi:hypothetical protein